MDTYRIQDYCSHYLSCSRDNNTTAEEELVQVAKEHKFTRN